MMSLTEKDKEWQKFKKKARKFQEKRVVTYAELQFFIDKMTEWWDKIEGRIKAMEGKQAEFETTFRNIMKRLLVLEGKSDQPKKS